MCDGPIWRKAFSASHMARLNRAVLPGCEMVSWPGGWFISQVGDSSVWLSHREEMEKEFFRYSPGLSARSITRAINSSAKLKVGELLWGKQAKIQANVSWSPSFNLIRMNPLFPKKTLTPTLPQPDWNKSGVASCEELKQRTGSRVLIFGLVVYCRTREPVQVLD